MKKLLSILAVCGLTATTGTTVVSCGKQNKSLKVKEQVIAKMPKNPVDVKLTKTHKTEKLIKDDQIKVQDAVIKALKEVNQGVVIKQDTFTVLGLTEMKASDQEVKVQVKETKSTVDKSGLKSNPELRVKVNLVPVIDKEQVDAKTPEKLVEIKLAKTHKGQTLVKEDQVLVQQKVIAILKEVNQDAMIEQDTFTVLGLTEMKTDAQEIKVQVKETKSTIDKSGLKSNPELKVKVSLLAVADKEQVKAKVPTNSIEIKLSKSYKGQILVKEDQTLVQQRVIDALKEANQDVVIEQDTFTVLGLTEIKSDAQEVKVQVKETKSIANKSGLIEEEVIVKVSLFSLDQISLKKLGTPSFKWEKGKDKTKELLKFVADLIKQLTNEIGSSDYIIKGNITGIPNEVGKTMIVEAKETSARIKDSFEILLQVDISDLKSWWEGQTYNSKIGIPGEKITKQSIVGYLYVALPGNPIFGKDYDFDGENFTKGNEIIIRSKEGSKCFFPGKSFIVVIL